MRERLIESALNELEKYENEHSILDHKLKANTFRLNSSLLQLDIVNNRKQLHVETFGYPPVIIHDQLKARI